MLNAYDIMFDDTHYVHVSAEHKNALDAKFLEMHGCSPLSHIDIEFVKDGSAAKLLNKKSYGITKRCITDLYPSLCGIDSSDCIHLETTPVVTIHDCISQEDFGYIPSGTSIIEVRVRIILKPNTSKFRKGEAPENYDIRTVNCLLRQIGLVFEAPNEKLMESLKVKPVNLFIPKRLESVIVEDMYGKRFKEAKEKLVKKLEEVGFKRINNGAIDLIRDQPNMDYMAQVVDSSEEFSSSMKREKNNVDIELVRRLNKMSEENARMSQAIESGNQKIEQLQSERNMYKKDWEVLKNRVNQIDQPDQIDPVDITFSGDPFKNYRSRSRNREEEKENIPIMTHQPISNRNYFNQEKSVRLSDKYLTQTIIEKDDEEMLSELHSKNSSLDNVTKKMNYIDLTEINKDELDNLVKDLDSKNITMCRRDLIELNGIKQEAKEYDDNMSISDSPGFRKRSTPYKNKKYMPTKIPCIRSTVNSVIGDEFVKSPANTGGNRTPKSKNASSNGNNLTTQLPASSKNARSNKLLQYDKRYAMQKVTTRSQAASSKSSKGSKKSSATSGRKRSQKLSSKN